MNKLYEENDIINIADAIRNKNGSSSTYKVSEMSRAIREIPTGGGGIIPTGTIDIVENGIIDVTEYANANVQVPSGGITPTGTIDITENGTYDVTSFASANIQVPAGGGLPSNMYTGTFIGDKVKNSVIHITGQNFKSIPIQIIVFPTNEVKPEDFPLGDMVQIECHYIMNGILNQCIRKGANQTTFQYGSAKGIDNVTTDGFDILCSGVNFYYPDVEFTWIAFCW